MPEKKTDIEFLIGNGNRIPGRRPEIFLKMVSDILRKNRFLKVKFVSGRA